MKCQNCDCDKEYYDYDTNEYRCLNCHYSKMLDTDDEG